VKYITIEIAVIGSGVLVLLIAAAWLGLGNVSVRLYRGFRALVAVAATVYAAISIYRIATQVAIPQNLNEVFVPELIGYIILWVLAPPLWFFFEFLAANTKWVTGLATTADELKLVKDYSDLASKIWAAVLAILAGLIALKH
jgi:hypothetical protein